MRVLKFNEAHRPLRLRTETHPLIASLPTKHGLQLVLRRLSRKVANVKRVTWWILIGRIGGRVRYGKVVCIVLLLIYRRLWPSA
jgi:hypothetical protein